MNGRANRFNKCMPIASPNIYAMNSMYRTFPECPEFVFHFKINQTTMLVKNVEREYTSASTALNQ